MDTGFLTHIEHGDKMPGLLTLAKIAQGLGVPNDRPCCRHAEEIRP